MLPRQSNRAQWRGWPGLLTSLLVLAAGCETTRLSTQTALPTHHATRPSVAPAVMGVARRIEAAHGLDAWAGKPAVACDLTIRFGGGVMLSGSMLYDPAGGRARMELDNGEILVFDGRRAWISPSSAEVPMARFHLLTWPYFMAAPFKLHDPGTHLTPLGRQPLHGKRHVTVRLTFDAGIGDSPDDWYVVYEDPDTSRLAAVAYIVTYGTSVAEAEKEPHVLVYEDFETIDGVVLSSTWTMYNWSLAQGTQGEPIGDVTLTNVRFVEPGASDFTRPAGAREAPLP